MSSGRKEEAAEGLARSLAAREKVGLSKKKKNASRCYPRREAQTGRRSCSQLRAYAKRQEERTAFVTPHETAGTPCSPCLRRAPPVLCSRPIRFDVIASIMAGRQQKRVVRTGERTQDRKPSSHLRYALLAPLLLHSLVAFLIQLDLIRSRPSWAVGNGDVVAVVRREKNPE